MPILDKDAFSDRREEFAADFSEALLLHKGNMRHVILNEVEKILQS